MAPLDFKTMFSESVQSADRKPEKYIKPDGKVGIRMVKTDKEVIKKEAIVDPNDLKGRPKKADPNPESPYGIKHPLHPVNLKKKKAKSEASSPSVLKPTKPSDITKHARTLAKNPGDYERNKKKYIDKARAKVFRMYPKESLNGLMKEESVDEAMSLDQMMRMRSQASASQKKNQKKRDEKEKKSMAAKAAMDMKANNEATWPDEMPPTNEDKYSYFDTKDDAHAHAKKHGGKVYKNTGKGATKVKGKPVNTHVVIKDEVDVDEALNMQQRMKKSRLMKRLKTRIKIGRDRSRRKMANKKTLEKRSNRQARAQIAKKLTRGIPKGELTFARKKEIEKRLEKPALQQRIKRLAKRMFKDVRKKEVQRKKG